MGFYSVFFAFRSLTTEDFVQMKIIIVVNIWHNSGYNLLILKGTKVEKDLGLKCDLYHKFL